MAKKTNKRGKNEGSITKRADGRWMAQVTDNRKTLDNKTKRLTYYGKTRQEVAEWLNKTLAEIANGTLAGDSAVTMEQWINRWLNTYAKAKVRQSTFDSYETTIRIHVVPSLGEIKLKDLRPEHLQSLYNQKMTEKRADEKQTLSAKTVGYIHGVIRQALQQAVREQLIVRNVADAVSKPRCIRHEITPLTPEQLQKFLETAKPNPSYPAFLLEWATGLRRGELLGLRWQDVDFAGGRIHVRQALIRTSEGLQISEPKTPKSRRTIPVPQQVMDALRDHQKHQGEAKELAGAAYADTGLVFANALGKGLDPRSFTRLFERLLDKAELPRVSFHDLRHSHATMLMGLGEHPKVVQERLGHSTIGMTLDTYSHVLPGLQEKVADKLGALLSPTPEKPSAEKEQ